MNTPSKMLRRRFFRSVGHVNGQPVLIGMPAESMFRYFLDAGSLQINLSKNWFPTLTGRPFFIPGNCEAVFPGFLMIQTSGARRANSLKTHKNCFRILSMEGF